MQAAAKVRAANNVSFRIADIAGPWRFAAEPADLVTSSLVLEHIEDLGHVFRESAKHLRSGGHFYICELHPVKQYMGSKARFETGGEVKVLECFTHHFSDYIGAALSSGFVIADIDEWFDDGGRQGVPRLVSFLFRRP
jgi:SAM-dependent methyltransferase